MSPANQARMCFYCQSPLEGTDTEHWHKVTMYAIHSRSGVHYKYSETTIMVPRCFTCKQKHAKGIGCTLTTLCTIVGVGSVYCVYRFALISEHWSEAGAFGKYFPIALFGLAASGLLVWITERVVIPRRHGIAPADEVETYGEIRELLDAGWLRSRPDPSSMPEVTKNVSG